VRLYAAQVFLLCVARSASVHSVVKKIKTLFTTEATDKEIKDKGFRLKVKGKRLRATGCEARVN
jgi:hypothetical protein